MGWRIKVYGCVCIILYALSTAISLNSSLHFSSLIKLFILYEKFLLYSFAASVHSFPFSLFHFLFFLLSLPYFVFVFLFSVFHYIITKHNCKDVKYFMKFLNWWTIVEWTNIFIIFGSALVHSIHTFSTTQRKIYWTTDETITKHFLLACLLEFNYPDSLLQGF